MNSDHAPAEMQVTHECYVASLIFLRGHIQQNELLPGSTLVDRVISPARRFNTRTLVSS